MGKAVVVIVMLVFLGSCKGPEMWIPQAASRPAVSRGHVQFLESPPQKQYSVIGIITPPSEQYETFAQAVRAMRNEAAKHGADAIFVESYSEYAGWRFSADVPGSWGGGSNLNFRAKAIVWLSDPTGAAALREPEAPKP